MLHNQLRKLSVVALVLFIFIAAISTAFSQSVCNFTFIQISDEHFPNLKTENTIKEIPCLKDIFLKPYNITALPPSFVIETGDLTEYGPINGAWALHNEVWKTTHLPIYSALGNHDQTWRALSPEMRKTYGNPYYSWNNYGCHFVVLNTPGLQDPRPVLGPEQLDWLKRDLSLLDKNTPVFLAFHHPLDTKEFSSPYETDRLMDILRPYNIAAILVGHSHGIRHTIFAGYDMIRGGSSSGPCPCGFNIISVLNDRLRIAYKERDKAEATIGLLNKPITAPEKPYPTIDIISPVEKSTIAAESVISAKISIPSDEISSAKANVDDDINIDLTLQADGVYSAAMASSLKPGAHYARVLITGKDDSVYQRSVSFYIDSNNPKIKWRSFIDSSTRSTPVISDNKVFVGANDGCFRAYDRESGKLIWRMISDGAVAGEACVLNGNVYFGSEDGYVTCLSAERGMRKWQFKTADPVFSSIVTDGKSVYCGSGSGAFYSINADTGELNWVNKDSTYNIESKPFITDGKIYYGSWDTYVYCLDTKDGKLLWKCMGQGSAEKFAPAYYSPADCGPVVAVGKVFIADRKFRLSVIDASTGKMIKFLKDISATGLSEDGNYVYIRSLGGNLSKIDSECNEVWSVKCSMDDVPQAPIESDGIVFVSSKRGLVSAIDASNGNIIWQYQATPKSYVFSSIPFDGDCAYVSGTDGSLTAIKK